MSCTRFEAGQRVRVQGRFPRVGHIRTPFYVRGQVGEVERVCGAFRNPEQLAFGGEGLPAPVLYRVRFDACSLWPDYAGSAADVVEVEIFEHWLERA